MNEGDDASLGVEPCYSHNERHAAMKQNRRLADYRRRVIEEAVAAA